MVKTFVVARISCRNERASHFLGPPRVSPSPTHSSVNRLGPAHIPLKRKGANAVGIQASTFASGVGDQAHMEKRGTCRVNECRWLGGIERRDKLGD